MFVKQQNYERYLDAGKTMLARAWGGAKNLMGNVDYALGNAQRIGNIAAPLVAEMAGDRGGSVKAKMDAARLQIDRARGAVGRGQSAQNRIEDVASQISGRHFLK